MKIVLLLSLGLFFLNNLVAQEMYSSIDSAFFPLQSCNPQPDSLSDLAFLDQRLKDVKVFGIGEASHGAREFFLMKHKMFQYLVEKHGFTVFAIEAGYAECAKINQYIQTGTGNPKELIRGMFFWTWNTQEVLNLVEWMKAYNETHSGKLTFIGMDMQFEFNSATEILQFIKIHEPQYGEEVTQLLNPLVDSVISNSEKRPSKKMIDAISVNLRRVESHLIAQSFYENQFQGSSAIKGSIQQHFAILNQYLRMAEVPYKDEDVVRDSAMAKNVLWALNHDGRTNKVMVWAHNGHISKDDKADDYKNLGWHLAQQLGSAYFAVGFEFNKGCFRAANPKSRKVEEFCVQEAKSRSLGHFLAGKFTDYGFVDLSRLRQESTFSRRMACHDILGAYNGKHRYWTIFVLKNYDAIIFINTIHSSIPIKRSAF